MWRMCHDLLQGHALDPHDPESFGFAFVGVVTGAHGRHMSTCLRIVFLDYCDVFQVFMATCACGQMTSFVIKARQRGTKGLSS